MVLCTHSTLVGTKAVVAVFVFLLSLDLEPATSMTTLTASFALNVLPIVGNLLRTRIY